MGDRPKFVAQQRPIFFRPRARALRAFVALSFILNVGPAFALTDIQGAADDLRLNAQNATISTSTSGNTLGHMYVCGRDPNANNDIPAIYKLSFIAATGVVSSVGIPRAGLVTDGLVDVACSPITEFNNPNGGGVGVANQVDRGGADLARIVRRD